MRVHHEAHGSDFPCPYLEGRVARYEERIRTGVPAEVWEEDLSRGWRRFGPQEWRPRCEDCTECLSVRLSVESFAPNRSQRRAERACAAIEKTWGRPSASEERLELLALWHRDREEARGWRPQKMSTEDYGISFAFPNEGALECQWRVEGELVAVGLFDETPSALSAVYFYFHPRLRPLGPGTANVVDAVARCAALGKSHLYLGLLVRDCPSLAYKARFSPREQLVGRPEPEERPVWMQIP